MVCMIFIVHTMPRRWVYLKMGLPDAYRQIDAFRKEPAQVRA
jgi:hypothetical protein